MNPTSEVVDAAIIATTLPECYAVINELLDQCEVPKDLATRARRLLPKGYSHSFEKKK